MTMEDIYECALCETRMFILHRLHIQSEEVQQGNIVSHLTCGPTCNHRMLARKIASETIEKVVPC